VLERTEGDVEMICRSEVKLGNRVCLGKCVAGLHQAFAVIRAS